MTKSELDIKAGAILADTAEGCVPFIKPTPKDTKDANVAFKLRDMAVKKVGIDNYIAYLHQVILPGEADAPWKVAAELFVMATAPEISLAAMAALEK
jgi:hypothetical protein